MTRLGKFLYILALPLPLVGESVWIISNNNDVPGDFVTLGEALISETVSPGDTLEVVPSDQSYGSVVLNKAVHLRGLPDASGMDLVPGIAFLTVPEDVVPEAGSVRIERISIDGISIQSGNVLLESCRIGAIAGFRAENLQVRKSWISLFTEAYVLLESSENVVFQGNLISIDGGATGFRADPQSWVSFNHNTVVDPRGEGEWVLYHGEFYDNIVMIPEGRFALFDVMPSGNLSTRRTFEDGDNQDSISAGEIFLGGTETIEQFLPNPDGPAIGTAADGSDLGFTGGPEPVDLSLIPGSGSLLETPPLPVIEGLEAIVAGLFLQWSTPEPIDQFELQVAVDGGSFANPSIFDDEVEEIVIEDLGEGISVQVRLRTVRDGLNSPWVLGGPVTTLYAPPPEPMITLIEPIVGGVKLDYDTPEMVDQFELQVSINGDTFGDSRILPGDSSEFTLTDLEEGVSVTVRLRSIRNELSSPWVIGDPVTTLVAYDPLAYYTGLLGGAIEQYDTWFQSVWFGWFSDFENSLILHLEHGYLYLLGIPGSVYVYDYATGLWFWTSEVYYPNLYLFQDPPQWYLYYMGTVTPNRYFYNHHTGENLKEDEL